MSGSGTSGEMSTAQLIQQVALLRWLTSQTEEDRRTLAALTGLQVGRELLNRFTGQDKVDAYKRECILSISQFLRENPRASEAQINAEVRKEFWCSQLESALWRRRRYSEEPHLISEGTLIKSYMLKHFPQSLVHRPAASRSLTPGFRKKRLRSIIKMID